MVVEERVFSGRYRVVALLGEGGMARVYKAVDERLRRVVAVKTLHPVYNDHPQLFARFEREARLAARLSHPNIVGIYDIGHDGAHYIVMEYVEGDTLKHLVGNEAPLASATCMHILRQICSALDYAHEQGVIHRDVKPENIFLSATRHVKVGDFGIARALDSTGITTAGMVMGSASYLSPEQAQGQPSTAQSDIYATGIVIFEMLTGRLPFSAATPLAMAMKHVDEMPPSPSSINPRLAPGIDAVVLKALAKDPAARYRSGADLIAALEREIDQPACAALQPVMPVSMPVAAEAFPARMLATGQQHPIGRARAGRALVESPLPARPTRSKQRLIPLALGALIFGAIGAGIAIHSSGLVAIGHADRHPASHGIAVVYSRAGTRTTRPDTQRIPFSAVSAVRRKHLQRYAAPIAYRRHQASSSLHAALTVARGEQQSGYIYRPAAITTRFDTRAAFAYVVASWHAGARHAFSIRWTMPGGRQDSYDGVNATGSAYAAIPLAAAGTYHTMLYLDSRQVAQRSFTVVPSNAAPPGGMPAPGAAASNPPTSVATTSSMPAAAPTNPLPAATPPSGSGVTGGSSSEAATGATIAQIEQAVSYANDVYMQVMNERDTSGVDSAFGAGLANANRGVAASLAARHEHYAIRLLGLSFHGVTMLGATTARVGVVKTESDPLYTDSGQLVQAGGAYTIGLSDLVQNINGRWVVTQVYH